MRRSNTNLALLPTLTLVAFATCTSTDEAANARADLAEVTRGALVISVIESGEIKAAKSTLVKNEMEGNSTIITLIDEGSIVKQGDVLVELDASSQIERRATQEITVQRSNAAVVNAGKDLDILRKQVKSEIQAAKNTLEFAKMDKKKFYGGILENGQKEMGEREQLIRADEAQISLKESDLSLAQEKFNWSVKLRAKDFITKEALDQDTQALKAKKTDLELAKNKLSILKKYTLKKTERELDQALADAQVEYERTIAKGEAQITQAEADLKSNDKENELAKERLENLITQIKNATVRAPTPGIVVYASEGDRWRRKIIEIGTQVRERQSLIILPDTSHMRAEMKIQEVMIDKIRPGLPALIKIDTSDTPKTGSVLRRAPLPDSGSRMGNPDLKEYKTLIDIDGNNGDQLLRPNMSATIEIIIAKLENVLSVPQQAIFSQGAVQYVWLKTDGRPVTKEVKIGENNESRVVILEGLEEGQMVFLVEPEGEQAPEFEQPKVRPEIAAVEAAASRIPPANGDGPTAGPPGNRSRRERGGGKGQRSGGKGERGDGQRRGRGSMGSMGRDNPALAGFFKASDTFKAAVKETNPELHAKIEAAGMRWSRDEEIKAAIDADEVLKAAYSTYQSEMRKMRTMRGGGEGRGDREGRGREGRSRRGGGGGRRGDGR